MSSSIDDSTPIIQKQNSLEMFGFGQVLESAVKKQSKKLTKMLTCSQLSDLFRRLDKDGSGELDIEEFLDITKKLHLAEDVEFITKVFRETAKSGNLGMNDFIRAYQKIYTHTSNQSTNSTKKTQHNTEFICATRYGVHVYEIFTGTNKSNTIIFNQRKTYKNINFLDVLDETVRDDMDEYFDIKDINMTMSDINKLILNDSINNVNISEYSEAAYWQHKVYWWIDIAMKQVTTGNVEKYIPEFGLPNDAKFKSSFAQFNKALPKNIKNHVYIATGESTRERTSSLSLFTQTMFLRNVPIVQCVPNWFHKVLPTTVINYYMTRFAFFFSNSLPSSHSVNEFNAAYEGANQIAQRLSDNNGFLEHDDDSDNETTEDKEKSDLWKQLTKDIPELSCLKPPLPNSDVMTPNWLLSTDGVNLADPKLRIRSLGIHIIDQGYGPSACITIRQISEEFGHDKSASMAYQSCGGEIGRIVHYIRIKLLENCRSSVSLVAGNLNNGPAVLALTLMNLVHNVSMNCLGTLNNWLKLIESEVEDIAVAKHQTHLKTISKLTASLKDYLEPTLEVMSLLCREEIDYQTRLHEELDAQKAEGSIEIYDITAEMKKRRVSMVKSRAASIVGAASTVARYYAPLPETVHLLPLSHKLMSNFVDERDWQYVVNLLEGDTELEIKGLRYWNDYLTNITDLIVKVGDDIKFSLDEKRNYYSFLLTIATISLSPLAVLTGYWGMNFDNMVELDSTSYPTVPGIKIMWLSAGVIYTVFMICAIHYRIIYAAT